MQDRYLYRAKRIFDGKWAEGFLTKINRQLHIVNQSGENAANQIDESTVCQCTGLMDKNGKLIFENDILSAHLDEKYPEDITYAKVIWWKNGFYTREKGSDDMHEIDSFTEQNYEVVGNIFDNLELLE